MAEAEAPTNTTLNSTELVQNCIQHVQFLHSLHQLGVTLEEPSLASADRYLNYWLPLVNKEHDRPLIPPPDIAWLWHCHRLAPARYQSYTERSFGRILEAKPPFAFQCDTGSNRRESFDEASTVALWKQHYPQEPFFLDKDRCRECVQRFEDLIADGFDVLASATRQKTFLWQVSGPRFQDEDFLAEGVMNYHRFLSLKPTDHSLPLVPTYQIDVVWHTHILTSISKYNADCVAIRKERFHHDDSLDDRTPEALLDLAFKKTWNLWKEEYHIEYVVSGGMYRGEPPLQFFKPSWNALATNFHLDFPELSFMGGSISTGAGVVESKYPSTWKPPLAADGTFIKANAKSHTRGINNNPVKDGYVFGREIAGMGYYSLETKEAYKILDARLSAKAKEQKRLLQEFLCAECVCLGCKPSRVNAEVISGYEEFLVKMVNMASYVRERAQSTGPYEVIDQSQLEANRKNLLASYGMKASDYPYIEDYFVASSPKPSKDNGEGSSAGGASDSYSKWNDDKFSLYTKTVCKAASCGGGSCGGGASACGGLLPVCWTGQTSR